MGTVYFLLKKVFFLLIFSENGTKISLKE